MSYVCNICGLPTSDLDMYAVEVLGDEPVTTDNLLERIPNGSGAVGNKVAVCLNCMLRATGNTPNYLKVLVALEEADVYKPGDVTVAQILHDDDCPRVVYGPMHLCTCDVTVVVDDTEYYLKNGELTVRP